MTRSGKPTYVVVVSLGILFAFPLVWLVLTSLRPNIAVLSHPSQLFGGGFAPGNYHSILKVIDIPRETINSLVMSVGVTVGTVALAAPAGYGFARLRLPAGNVVFAALIASMVIPFEAIFIPLYLFLAKLGWVNTFAALIVPGLASPFAIFVFRQYYLSVPEELLESMRVDGAGNWRIFRSLFLPLSGPPIATVGILTFLAQWSNLLGPLVFTTTQNMYTLQVGLNFINTGPFAGTPQLGWLMAGVALSCIPPVVVFLLLQKRFVKSLAATGLKG